MELNANLLSILFGLTGTLILFISPIKLFFSKIKKDKDYYLLSQALGFLFLLDGFLYVLIGGLWKVNPGYVWFYATFLILGVYISVFMIREVHSEIYLSALKELEFWIPFIFLASSIFLWFKGRSEEHTSELQSHVNLVCR